MFVMNCAASMALAHCVQSPAGGCNDERAANRQPVVNVPIERVTQLA